MTQFTEWKGNKMIDNWHFWPAWMSESYVEIINAPLWTMPIFEVGFAPFMLALFILVRLTK
jgi:hypothetical protein